MDFYFCWNTNDFQEPIQIDGEKKSEIQRVYEIIIVFVSE